MELIKENVNFWSAYYDEDTLRYCLDKGFNWILEDEYYIRDSYDYWSGLNYPEYHSNIYGFETKEDLDAFKIQLADSNPNDKFNEVDVNEAFKESMRMKEEAEKEREKEEKRKQTREKYLENLPEWRNTRTRARDIKANLDYYLKEYEEISKQLAKELKEAGVEYDSIEEVLTREFLKKIKKGK